MFAILALPMAAMLGLAIDYARLDQTQGALYLAANSAALNAVKVAATGQVNNDANYVSEAQAAGAAWSGAQLGTAASQVSGLQTQVTVTPGATITVAVTLSGRTSPLFGRLFGISGYTVSATATAAVSTDPYLEVVMMLDNSSSMAMGATIADMTTLLNNSPCDKSHAFITTNGGTYTQASNTQYGLYQCSYYGHTYDGTPACPLVVGSTTYATATRQTTMGPACKTKVNGYTAYAGPPCAFACHWDSSKAAGLGTDLWAMARRKGVAVRSDLVKNATRQVLAAMSADNQAINNLSIGIYTFDSSVKRIYPSSGEAGSDWSAAQTAVGAPPTAGSGVYTETGYQPVVGGLSGDNNNTNFQTDMSSLATTYVTPAGDGSAAASPRKVLILITDGIEDDYVAPSDGSESRYPMPYSACQQFKDMGYKVYVAYIPYYPIMQTYYLYYMMGFNEGTGPGSVAYNLRTCSSSTGSDDLATYYVQVSDQTGLNNALQGFLKAALTSPARLTR